MPEEDIHAESKPLADQAIVSEPEHVNIRDVGAILPTSSDCRSAPVVSRPSQAVVFEAVDEAELEVTTAAGLIVKDFVEPEALPAEDNISAEPEPTAVRAAMPEPEVIPVEKEVVTESEPKTSLSDRRSVQVKFRPGQAVVFGTVAEPELEISTAADASTKNLNVMDLVELEALPSEDISAQSVPRAGQAVDAHMKLMKLTDLVEPPSPQEFAPLHSQAVGRVPRPLEITPSHDMYLQFGLLLPSIL